MDAKIKGDVTGKELPRSLAALLNDTVEPARMKFLHAVEELCSQRGPHATAVARALRIYVDHRSTFSVRTPTAHSRGKRPSHYAGAFADLRDFRDELGIRAEKSEQKLSLPKDAANLRNFCTGSTEKPHGIFLLALFLADVVHQNPDLTKHFYLAREDSKLLHQLELSITWLSDPGDRACPLSTWLTAQGDAKAGRTNITSMASMETIRTPASQYLISSARRRAQLQSYFDEVAFGNKGHANFVCYRPQVTSPSSLIKSFLAVVPPGDGEHQSKVHDTFTFLHVYKAEEGTLNKRISRGFVFPWEEGLYFIGGQIETRGEENVDSVFRTLKVIAIPWRPIELRTTIVPAVALSANKQGRHIVTRLAIRPTISTDDKLADVRPVPVRNLLNDLAKMNEEEAATEKRPKILQTVEEPHNQARHILEAVNNLPNVDATGYVNAKTKAVLSQSDIKKKLEDIFLDEHGQPVYKRGDDWLTWNDLRFGALGTTGI